MVGNRFRKKTKDRTLARVGIFILLTAISVFLSLAHRSQQRSELSEKSDKERAEIRNEAERRFSEKQVIETGESAEDTATKQHEWEARKKVLDQRWSKNVEQTLALSRVNDEPAILISIFKGMSDEQLEHIRQDLLKTEDADKINRFFDDVAGVSTKTDEQIQQDSADLLISPELYEAAFRELDIEWELLLFENINLNHTKPF